MPPISRLVLPPKELASCVAGCLYRNTCGADLTDQERLNYFPASPLFAASVMLSGDLHAADTLMPLREIKDTPIAPKYVFSAPKHAPHMSWSPGSIEGFTVAFYPDAWQTLGGGLDGTPPDCLPRALAHFEEVETNMAWPLFWDEMRHAWDTARRADGLEGWIGSDRIKTWTYHLLSRATQTGTGRSLRSAQRRIRRWAGHDIQTLNFFARIEDLHQLVTEDPDATPVDLAAGAGFADQSHMGRELKRATGFSPVQLNQRIAEDESFWCYRLLGERF
jgi:AraC-like DNA-binding protein